MQKKRNVKDINNTNIKEALFLFYSKKNSLFAKYIENEGYQVQSLVKYDLKVLLALKKTVFRAIFREVSINEHAVSFEGIVILFDSNLTDRELIEFRKKSKAKRLVIVIWNPVESIHFSLTKARELGYELWSYSYYQCSKYNLKQNLSFYCDSMYSDALKKKPKELYDIVFVGKDKGRLKNLEDIIGTEPFSKYKAYLYITATHFWEVFKNVKYKINLTYDKVQVIQMKSRAILELCPSQNVGITMRTIDSLILRKKLITDSKSIKNEEFYDNNNVFVIDDDDISDFDIFMKREYKPVPMNIIQKYSIHEWVKRIIEDSPIVKI